MELAVLVPLALIVLLSAVQAGIWWHTRSLCLHAATDGAQAGRTVGGTSTGAHAAATDFLTGGTATAPQVSVHTGPEAVTVWASATAPRILPIPGLDMRVEQVARASTERFTTPGGKP